MYADFYGFREMPFNITPDPRFLYLNDCYQEALAALAYGIEARKGFISLIGEAGTGKTTMLRRLLDTLDPRVKTVLLLNPTVTFDEILEHILIELGIPTDGGGKLVLLRRLNEFLLEHTSAGGNVVLLIDEAQDLKTTAIEELRLLSNLETAREKILQIVLAGQPELEDILRNPALRQLRQRIALHVRVRPLSGSDVSAYIRTRLQYAGARDLDLFTPAALERVAAFSRGIPRLVNVLCDAALLTGFVGGTRPLTAEIVESAWSDYASDEPFADAPAAPAIPPPATDYSPPPPPEPAAPPAPVVVAAPVAPPRYASRPPAPSPAGAAPAEPVPLAPVAVAPAPTPRREMPVAAVARPNLSVPAAAALVGLITVAVYGVALYEDRVRSTQPEAVVAEAPSPPPAGPEVAEAVAATPPPELPPAPEGQVSAAEATDMVEQFRAAYEARDAARLVALFATDASENGRRGHEAIRAAYTNAFAVLTDVHYALPTVAVAGGQRANVRAPFIITYREPGGAWGVIRGDAEWGLERRSGRPQIVSLSYRLQPQG